MMKLAAKERKDKKKRFWIYSLSSCFFFLPSYCFPLQLLFLLLLLLILKLAKERAIFNMIILSSQICERRSS
jgi:hypothetical protein